MEERTVKLVPVYEVIVDYVHYSGRREKETFGIYQEKWQAKEAIVESIRDFYDDVVYENKVELLDENKVIVSKNDEYAQFLRSYTIKERQMIVEEEEEEA